MSDPAAALEVLKQKFVRNAGAKFDAMAQALDRLRANPGDEEQVDALLRLFHGFAGISATYGFPEASRVARDAEGVFHRVLDEQRVVTRGEIVAAQEALDAIRRVVQGASSEGEPHLESSLPPPPAVILAGATVNEAFGGLLARGGYRVIAVGTVAEATRQIDDTDPVAVITESELPDGEGTAIAEHTRRVAGNELAAIYLTGAGRDFIDRVEAIRCGADGLLDPATDAEKVVRIVEAAAQRRQRIPARILCVEDDADQSAFIVTILESAGYETRVCADPMYFEADVTAFRPDLILMDYLLPRISGSELARLVRQQESFATVPIVFLTTESAVQRRVEVLRAGADDYLLKPVQPSLLLSAVAAKLERARFLRSLIERDGLTGLLTHSALMERIKSAAALAARYPDRSPALVMVDLDHFKRVNDRYGHPTGDRVLVALATLLRRRLRQSDVTGRYGGEEFGAILEELTADQARRLVERLLDEFATTSHTIPDGTALHVTFSAGIAMFDRSRPEPAAWIAAADAALYEAKRGGRNRVVVAN